MPTDPISLVPRHRDGMGSGNEITVSILCRMLCVKLEDILNTVSKSFNFRKDHFMENRSDQSNGRDLQPIRLRN